MSWKPDEVITELERLRLRWWLFSTLYNVVLTLSISLNAWLALVLGQATFGYGDQTVRTLVSAWALATLLALVIVVVKSFRRQRSLAATARRVEMTFPSLQNSLIAIVQFHETPSVAFDGFQQAAIAEAATAAASVPMHATADQQTRWQRWQLRLQTPRDLAELSGILLLLVLLLLSLDALWPRWSSANDRLRKSLVINLTDDPVAQRTYPCFPVVAAPGTKESNDEHDA